MKIGNLNRRIDILEYIVTRDEYGGEDGEWKIKESLWANIEPISGTEFFQAQTVNAETVVKVTLRFNPRINVTHRVRYQDKLFEIIGVADGGTAHRATILNCKEKVNDGIQRKTT